MNVEYRYETFSASSADFDSEFTDYLNQKSSEGWQHKQCYFERQSIPSKLYAYCTFTKTI